VQVRGQTVVLDSDLAEFYGVETRSLNQQIERNAVKFPDDFAFRVTQDELDDLRSQNVIANGPRRTRSLAKRRDMPRVFTEVGAVAAAGVLSSDRAGKMSVLVHRAFTVMTRQLTEPQKIKVLREVAHRMAAFDQQDDASLRGLEERLGELEKRLKLHEGDTVEAFREFYEYVELLRAERRPALPEKSEAPKTNRRKRR